MRIPLTKFELTRTRKMAADPYDSVAAGRILGVDHLGAGFCGGIDEYIAGGPDINPELSGRSKYPVYREMKTSDAAIRSLVYLYKLPIRSAEWSVVPADTDPDGEAAARWRADFAAWQFGLERHKTARLGLSWDQLNEQDLLFLDYGAMGGELIWAVDDRGKPVLEPFIDEDGDAHPVRALAMIGPRLAATVEEIEADPYTGKIKRLRQEEAAGEGWIPGTKMTWLVNEKEGDNWFGQSLLRSAYGAWLIKKELIVTGAIAYQRWAMGIPEVRHPSGDQHERRAAAIGRSVSAHERAYLTFEGVPANEGGTGSDWGFTIHSAASSIADPVNYLRHLDGQIAMTGLQQFSQLGTTERGSRAVGDVLVEPFYLAVQAVAKQMAHERMESVLRRLWDVNFGEHIPTAEFAVSKIQGRNIATLARALADLSTAGLTFTDRDTQDDVRDMLDLRHLPEEQRGPVGEALDQLPEDIGVTNVPSPNGMPVPPVEGGTILPVAV